MSLRVLLARAPVSLLPERGESDLSDRVGMLKSCTRQSEGFEAEAATGGASRQRCGLQSCAPPAGSMGHSSPQDALPAGPTVRSPLSAQDVPLIRPSCAGT